MTSAVESFVIALARASKRGSYHLRGLGAADRDDVLATALSWCWENKAKYDPQLTLEQWFDTAIQEARSAWFGRGRRKKPDAVIGAKEFNETMAQHISNPTVEAAEQESGFRALRRQLTHEEWAEVREIMSGERQKLNVSLRFRLQKFRDLLPEAVPETQKLLRALARESDSHTKDLPLSRIDRQLAQLTAIPRHGADCPPCWRCMWYMGFKPPFYIKLTTTPADPELQAAIWATEQRKIDIATGVGNDDDF